MLVNYVGRWSQAQLDQFELSEEIDRIAERLPLYDLDALSLVAAKLSQVLSRVHRFEEGELFPRLEKMSPQIRLLLVTFRTHHKTDAETANSICRTLNEAPSLDSHQLNGLKTKLASFAESLRRHVQFEEAITMALFASKRVDERRLVQ